MKSINSIFPISILASIVFIFGLSSCEEVPPPIDFFVPLADSTFVASDVPQKQAKVVVLEEFSGVKCVNCPQGNTFVEGLLEEHDDQLISMTLHAGQFAIPLSSSEESFSTEETEIIDDFLEVGGYPAATVDRIQFSGQDFVSMTFPFSSWATAVEERIQTSPSVNLTLSKVEADESERYYRLKVEMIYTEDLSKNNNLSLFILESGIIDPQLTSDPAVVGGYIGEYEHNHVVRTMLTSPLGTSVNDGGIVKGLTVIKEFEVNFEESWDLGHLEFVAFVHNSGDSKEILQGAKLKAEF